MWRGETFTRIYVYWDVKGERGWMKVSFPIMMTITEGRNQKSESPLWNRERQQRNISRIGHVTYACQTDDRPRINRIRPLQRQAAVQVRSLSHSKFQIPIAKSRPSVSSLL